MQKLSKEDISDIVEALQRTRGCDADNCPFMAAGISPEDLRESIQFFKNFNAVFGKTGSIIWNTLLVAGVTGTLSLIILGLIAKIKQIFPQ